MEDDVRNVYCFLKELCADDLQVQGRYREGRSQSVHSSIAKLKSDHLIELSNVLFEELLGQFENLHALLRCPSDGVFGLNSEAQFTKEGFIVLLRCCLMMLQFLEFDMSHLWEKCGVLFKILGKFCPLNLALDSHGCSVISTRNSFSPFYSCFLGGINEEADQLLNLFPLILEVFIAEFSENVGLRMHLIPANVLASNSEKLCTRRNTHTDNCTILELVCSHFLISVKSDLDFSRFLHSLSGSSDIDKMTPEISLDASLKLISTPFILSAPRILQAHLILLASRCISTRLPIDDRKSDTPVMSCYINPFELAVNLYLSYLSTLQLDDAILGANGRSNLGVMAPPCDSSVHNITWDKLTHRANDLIDFSLHSEGILSGTKSEVIVHSAAYIRGDHPLIDQLCKEATCLVVDYMVENILPRKEREQRHNENRERIQQEVYCLAAAMKLMNSSLLHIIWILRQTGCHGEMKTVRDCSPCMTYECVSQLATITRVNGCGADQQVQDFLCNMLGSYGGMHQEIKFMLAHISSLLVFSFRRKLEFLWKGCISMMMTLMNLLLFEERNLGLSKIFKLLQSLPRMDYKSLSYRSTSVMIATNLQKTRRLFLKNEIKYVHVEENRTDAGERSEVDEQSKMCSVEGINYNGRHETQGNTCNGERFTECVPSYHTNPLEWENLVDFIECSPEKDYHSWLKNRNKFNKWKQEKSAILKNQMRKKRTYIKKFSNLCASLEKDYSSWLKNGNKFNKWSQEKTAILKRQKRKKMTNIKKVSNLSARTDSNKSIEVKLQSQRSRISHVEGIKDRGVHEILVNTCGGESFTECIPSHHTDPSDLVESTECSLEKCEQEKSGLLKPAKRKKKTSCIKSVYNLRAR